VEQDSHRNLHKLVAEERLIRRADLDALATTHKVTRRTIQIWIRHALGYPDCVHLLSYADPRSKLLPSVN
jgi:hypothetical protein